MPFRAEGHALDRVLTADNGCPKRPSCCGIPEDDCLFCLARGHFVGTERGQHSSIWAESYALSVDITFLGRCSPRDTQRDSIKQAVKQKVAFGEEEAMV